MTHTWTKRIIAQQISCAFAAAVLLFASETRSLNVYSGKRDESMIVVEWNETASTTTVAPSTSDGGRYRVSYKRVDEPPEMLVYTAWLNANTTAYKIRHLPANTKFKICVSDRAEQTEPAMECVVLATVPIMLTTSIIAICGVICYFALCIILGYCCWKRKKASLSRAATDDDDDLDSYDDREALQPRRNKLSIEDPDVAVYVKDGRPHLMKYAPKNSTEKFVYADDDNAYCGTRV
ncbi:uncharacterized protein LOC141910875 [Tubulanus polymorphus]|uniref:uncharacterized protein LOC141910875 n=1 Tax=Tubulanus polymorphus TaxID=672921 RepID=UPI003DA68D34